ERGGRDRRGVLQGQALANRGEEALAPVRLRGAHQEAEEIGDLLGLEDEPAREPVLRHRPIDLRPFARFFELPAVCLELAEVLAHRRGADVERAGELGLGPRALLDEGRDDAEKGLAGGALTHGGASIAKRIETDARLRRVRLDYPGMECLCS